jgi:hypothetical protein
MKINAGKTRVISFSIKTYMLTFNNVFHYDIVRTACIKDLGAFVDSKLYSHKHVEYLFFHTIKLLDLIRTITVSFSSLDSLMMRYSS